MKAILPEGYCGAGLAAAAILRSACSVLTRVQPIPRRKRQTTSSTVAELTSASAAEPTDERDG